MVNCGGVELRKVCVCVCAPVHDCRAAWRRLTRWVESDETWLMIFKKNKSRGFLLLVLNCVVTGLCHTTVCVLSWRLWNILCSKVNITSFCFLSLTRWQVRWGKTAPQQHAFHSTRLSISPFRCLAHLMLTYQYLLHLQPGNGKLACM